LGTRGLVIFDLDGTLFQGAVATKLAVRRAFGQLGIDVPEDSQVQRYVGKPAANLHAWLRAYCSEEQAPKLLADVDRYELEYVTNGADLYPGAREALTQIRPRASQMAICTNGPQAYVDHVLDAHSLRRFFDRVRCRRVGDINKAAMVRELLGELDARPGIVVGDRHDDIEAAHANGLLAIAATYGYGSESELAAADAAAGSLAELPDLIRALLR
jgi:phosphoglycolate phosphatase